MTGQTTGARTGRPARSPAYSYCMALYTATAKLHEAHDLMADITDRMIGERGSQTPEDQLAVQCAITDLAGRIMYLAEVERHAEAEAGASLLAQLAEHDAAAAAAVDDDTCPGGC